VDFEDLIQRMAWICSQEGIDADPEALAILAAAGEGSVRDSLSALDQAIACCGAKLDAGEVRALLGAFSLESLEKVTQALAAGDSRSMLEVVDELERNGQNCAAFQPRAVPLRSQPAGHPGGRRGHTAGGRQRRAAREVGQNCRRFL
jgi:DNA polymerase-3 subunit gamma/tau